MAKLCTGGNLREVTYATVRKFANKQASVMAHVAKYPVRAVDLHNGPIGTGTLIINFGMKDNLEDTSNYAAVEFASFAVMMKQVANWRALRGVKLYFNGQFSGTTVEPNNLHLKV